MNFYVSERLWPGSEMSTKKKDIRNQFDTCFSKYKHRKDLLGIEGEDCRVEAGPPQIVDSDDELFYASQTAVERNGSAG